MMRIAPLLTLALLLPATAQAEGAQRDFACFATASCDGAGSCETAGQAATFALAPTNLTAEGSGTVTLSHDGTTVSARQLSDLGPWVWSETDGNQHTLMISGPDTMLWHRLSADNGGTAAILFLTCEVTG